MNRINDMNHPGRVRHDGHTAACRPETRRRILDVLEVCDRISRPQLAEMTGLGVMTVHRAADRLLREGILTETRGSDPVTGRMTSLLCPICPAPVLLADLTDPVPSVYVACGMQAPDPAGCIRVTRGQRDIFFPEDDLRQLIADARSVLPDDVTEVFPALLMPDTGTFRGLSAVRTVQIMVEELQAGRLRLLPDGRRRGSAAPVLVMSAEQAACYAAVRDPAVRGLRSLMVVRDGGCGLLTRSQADGAWEAPPLLEGAARAVREALTLPGENAEGARTLLSMVTPGAVICGGDADGEFTALLRSLLSDGVPVLTSGCLLSQRGILMRARRDMWQPPSDPHARHKS